MKELNKLIEEIAFPLRYEESNNGILDANNQWVCEVYGGLADGNLIAHALNNLQPKEGEQPVSGEAQLGVWTTEAQKEAAKGRALIDDITPEAQMRRENK